MNASRITLGLALFFAASPAFALSGNEVAKLVADDAASEDIFGLKVAIHKDTAVVGAQYDDDLGDRSGSAYVFVRAGSTWVQQQKLLPDDGDEDDFFGSAVAIHGNTIVVGARRDDEFGDWSGSAYVFVRTGSTWTQQQKLLASNGGGGDEFATSVTVLGNTIVIGAPFRGPGGAYVFQRTGTTWNEVGIVPYSGFGFGLDVALDADTLVVTDPFAPVPLNEGAARVFTGSGATWTLQGTLISGNTQVADKFGFNADVSGDTVIVSAHEDDELGMWSGSAYVFARHRGVWSQQQKLLASDGAVSDRFGLRVGIDGDIAIVGADLDGDNGPESGSAYVFVRNGNSWSERAKLLPSDGFDGDNFARRVAIDGAFAIAGAHLNDDAGSASGSAYIFALSQPVIASVTDVNGNAQPEVAALVFDPVNHTNRVILRDGNTDALVNNINVGSDPVADIAAVASSSGAPTVFGEAPSDIDGNGVDDIVVLSRRPSGQIRVRFRDSGTGAVTSTVFFGAGYSGIDLAVVPDLSGNGQPELAVLGESDTGVTRVQVRDAVTGAAVSTIFLGTTSRPHSLHVLPDISGNGLHEIATVGTVRATGQVRARVQDIDSKAFLRNIFFGTAYRPVAFTVVPDVNGNGSSELAQLGVRADGGARLLLKDSLTAAPVTIVFLGATNSPVDLVVIPDTNANGFADVAVLLRRVNGTGSARIYDSSSGDFLRNVFFGQIRNPADIQVSPDMDGNGFSELLVIGDGGEASRVQIRDSSSGAQVNNVDFP